MYDFKRMNFKLQNDNKILIGCLCALGCEVLFGLSYVFTKQATVTAGALELLCWRFIIAFVVMSILAHVGIIKIDLKGKNLKDLFAVTLFSPVLYFIGETVGIGYTSASESGVFLACIPVASLVASSFVLKKRPEKTQLVGIAITLAGVLTTVFAAGVSTTFSVVGYAFLTIAVVSYALYSVFVEKASAFSEAEITYLMLGIGAAVFVSSAFVRSIIEGSTVALLRLPIENTSFLIAILYQGIGCSILAFFLSNMAIVRIGVNRTSSFIGASTVVSMIAGMVILQENITSLQIAGAAIIVAGIYIANIKKKTYEFASKENIKELYELQLVAFESEAEMIGSRNVPALLESYDEFKDDFGSWNVLIRKNSEGKIIGAARYKAEDSYVEVGRVFVMPEYRNRGIAMALLKAIEEESGGSVFELYTCTRSWINIRLYEKSGYTIYKEEKGERDLSFAYMRKTI